MFLISLNLNFIFHKTVNSSQDFRESTQTNDSKSCDQKEYILPNVLNEDLENPKTTYSIWKYLTMKI